MSQSTTLSQILGSSQLQSLLSNFNTLDSSQSGLITITQAINFFTSLSLFHFDSSILRSSLLTSNQLTFDQFLVLLHQTEKYNNIHQSSHNHRLIEFMNLLEDYRHKCQMEQNYSEAKKSYKRIEEIIDKQVKREESHLKSEKKKRLEYVNGMEKEKMYQFTMAWKQYHQEFEESARNAIEGMKEKHLLEMEREERSLKREWLRPRQTRALRQMREQERLLVKLKIYDRAEKVKDQFKKLEIQETRQQQEWVLKKITQKTQNLRKKQQASLMAQLKKLQISRDLQQKKQKQDAQKLIFKLKRLKDQIEHEEMVLYKNNVSRIREEMVGSLDRKKRFRSVPQIVQKKGREFEYNPEDELERKEKKKGVGLRIRVNSFNRPRFDQETSFDDI